MSAIDCRSHLFELFDGFVSYINLQSLLHHIWKSVGAEGIINSFSCFRNRKLYQFCDCPC